MHRISLVLLFAIGATAHALPAVRITPVGITCDVKVRAITQAWPSEAEAEKRLAVEAKRILAVEPQFMLWTLVAEQRPTGIEIVFEKLPTNKLVATIHVHHAGSDTALPPVTIRESTDLESEGWPTEEREVIGFLTSHVLTEANRNALWTKLKRVEVGVLGEWSTEPPVFALPVRWDDRFATYSSVLRAGPALKVVVGMSLHESAKADVGSETVPVLVARAKCVVIDGAKTPPPRVADLRKYTLGPVYVDQKPTDSPQPAIDCRNEGSNR